MGNILINRHKPSSMLEAVSSQNHWILSNSPCWACCHSTGKLWNGVKPFSGWFPLQWNYLKKVKSASDVVGICKNGFLMLRCWVPNGLKKVWKYTLYSCKFLLDTPLISPSISIIKDPRLPNPGVSSDDLPKIRNKGFDHWRRGRCNS